LYEIVYFDPTDLGFGEASTRVWAYSTEHAIDRFADSTEFEGGGWDVSRIAAVRSDAPRHRWRWIDIKKR
jgi:hypothetical protein